MGQGPQEVPGAAGAAPCVSLLVRAPRAVGTGAGIRNMTAGIRTKAASVRNKVTGVQNKADGHKQALLYKAW